MTPICTPRRMTAAEPLAAPNGGSFARLPPAPTTLCYLRLYAISAVGSSAPRLGAGRPESGRAALSELSATPTHDPRRTSSRHDSMSSVSQALVFGGVTAVQQKRRVTRCLALKISLGDSRSRSEAHADHAGRFWMIRQVYRGCLPDLMVEGAAETDAGQFFVLVTSLAFPYYLDAKGM